jgi:hypothetical protein
MQEAELTRMAGDDYKKRESCKMASWIRPKGAHKAMVSKLLQVRAHLILAFRAEQKIEMVRDPQSGKLVVRQKESLTGYNGWIPICEKNLPFELSASFLLTADKPGVPHPIKLMEDHRPLIPLDKPLDESIGEKLAAWARGGSTQPTKEPSLKARAEQTAELGMLKLEQWWASITKAERLQLKPILEDLKAIADKADHAVDPSWDDPSTPIPEPDMKGTVE